VPDTNAVGGWTNIGMGPFEPVVCSAGTYCPDSGRGREQIICPSGSYCQDGAATPTPCAFGSSCPAGSSFERFLVPLGLLLTIDVLLIVGTVLLTLRKRRTRNNQSAYPAARKGKPGMMRAVATGLVGYRALPDDHATDAELLPMNATYIPGQDPWSGLNLAIDMANSKGTRVEDVDPAALTPQLRAFIESMRKATDASHFGLSFQYSGLGFQPKGNGSKKILQNITGSVNRGALAAVMGGSGAGKSTFVNVLMGKTPNTGGTVMVNYSPGKIARYKKLIGFVPQDDILLPELTCRENVLHSARIRLPRTWSNAQIEAHVDAVLDCLELTHVKDSLVGSVGKPVISGGQRKRVSIGMELAAAPMAIFLDEPTSGLDATSASSIMRTLQALARLGITVIVIIHQPRLEIWEMIDDLMLLGNGQTIYEGKQADVQKYFENGGFHFPEHCNAGDVITDIITGNGRPYKSSGDISKESLIEYWAGYQGVQNGKNGPSEREQHALMTNSAAMTNSASTHQVLKMRGAPRLKQAVLCLRRAMLQQYRAKSAFWFEMGLAGLAGLLIGLAVNSRSGNLFRGVYNSPLAMLSTASDYISAPQLALLVAIAIGLVAAAPGVKVFSEELLLQRREAEAGHSRVAYFVAKMIATLPRMFLACLHFTTWLMLLAVPIIPWGIAFMANLLYFYSIYGLAACISMLVRREDAPLFATMISLIVGILSGAAPSLSQVQSWHMDWLWRASPGVWIAEVYFGQLVSPSRYLYQVDMAAQITGFHLEWLWRNMLILFGIGTLYRILAYIGLLLGKRLRRS
jgi:ABC-type multidrug transport system ATPase subunit